MTMENPPPTASVSVLLSAIVGRKTAQAISRRPMAILLATLVLLILSRPIADVAIQARLVIICATVGFRRCLQQVDAYPRLLGASPLLVRLGRIRCLKPCSSCKAITRAMAT